MKRPFVRKFAALVTAAVALVVVVPAGAAHAAQKCYYSVSTDKYLCNGDENQVRLPSDVPAGRVFTGRYYEGDSLTIFVPRDCVKDGYVDHTVLLQNTQWRRNVGSVQPFFACYIWLNFEGGGREGPYTKNTPDVAAAGAHTTEIALS